MFFFKTLLKGLKTKLGCIKNFMWEHLQNFTFPSDIDWSQSIADIDKKLYKKYNLTDDEISYIEGTIKSMDTEPSKQKYTPQDVMANYINRQLQQQSK